MRTSLLEHNKTAYRKVTEALQSANRTCVVHPTGTGKSYLIAAVSEGYKQVLVLGPNTFVLDQVADVLKWRKRGIEYMTYALLMHTENPRTDYDLICLDEFHRAGAPEWGAAIDRLLALNPQAKVLGTTATPVRWLDDNRDMADELFGGNVASQMSIAEAWNRNILPIPRYVSGLFRWDKAIAEATDRINRNRTLTDDDINKIFDKELGLSAKQLCNSIKFQFLLDDMNKGIGDSFTSIASEYNFYDQAHFIHEFKEFSGKTPGEYAEEVENKKYISSIKNI
jgi:superfamily II DNA or RNA helicase